MQGPLPDRELCIEISPNACRQEEFLNDFGGSYWQSPDAKVNARPRGVGDGGGLGGGRQGGGGPGGGGPGGGGQKAACQEADAGSGPK